VEDVHMVLNHLMTAYFSQVWRVLHSRCAVPSPFLPSLRLFLSQASQLLFKLDEHLEALCHPRGSLH
jgi:hypothetical protein